jgi:hypothetical protein
VCVCVVCVMGASAIQGEGRGGKEGKSGREREKQTGRCVIVLECMQANGDKVLCLCCCVRVKLCAHGDSIGTDAKR